MHKQSVHLDTVVGAVTKNVRSLLQKNFLFSSNKKKTVGQRKQSVEILRDFRLPHLISFDHLNQVLLQRTIFRECPKDRGNQVTADSKVDFLLLNPNKRNMIVNRKSLSHSAKLTL